MNTAAQKLDSRVADQTGTYPELKLLIAGVWTTSAETQPVVNPSTEAVIGCVPQASKEQIGKAIEAAQSGLLIWRSTAPAKRAQIILRAAQIIRERTERIAHAISIEHGKPLAQARAEISRACEFLEWDANEGRRMYGRIIPLDSGMRCSVVRQPVGIVAGFTPWNFPISIPARKVGGALAAGCALILKASEETPAGALLLVEAFVDAGLPAGVLTLLFGRPAEISEQLISHPSVRFITFTGSIPVGKHLSELAGRYMKPVTMELGGHAPVIVCHDVEPKKVAAIALAGKLRNAGQVCVSPTRFFVHQDIYPSFAQEFTQLAERITIGDSLDPATQLGPLANERRVEAIDSLVSDAVNRGGRLLCGGVRPNRPGFFYPLTAIGEVPDNAIAMQEEPFGPLALLTPFSELDDAIRRANALPYGLAAYAFTSSARQAGKISDEIECGNLAINHMTASTAETPFGGVKDSGLGREGGVEGLETYTVVKNVSHLVQFDCR